MLNEVLANNKYVASVMEHFQDTSCKRIHDIESAYNLLLEFNGNADDFISERIYKSYIMTHYMEPDVEDIIAILLYENYLGNRPVNRQFDKHFEDTVSEKYLKWTVAVKTACNGNTMSEKDTWIMERVCDKMYDSIIKTMRSSNKMPDTLNVLRAYNEAKNTHKGVLRKTGEPYLTHPLKVAKMLADIGLESDVIAAALLHDVAEDSKKMTHEEAIKYIEGQINPRVAKYVNAVSSVDKQYHSSLYMSEFGKDKSELDEETLKKLIKFVSSDRLMVYALYIKAADRIHNLRTLDGMTGEKVHLKLDETDNGYLPLFKHFGLRYFTDEIEDLVWKADNPTAYNTIKTKYDNIVNNNKELIEKARFVIEKSLKDELPHVSTSMGCFEGFETEVNVTYHKTYKLAKFARSLNILDADFTEYIRKSTIPLCNINIILDAKETGLGISDFSTMFIKVYSRSILKKGLTITKLDLDKYNRFIIYFEDTFRNHFRCCIYMRDDYLNYTYGNHASFQSNIDTLDTISSEETVRVILRNGNTKQLPEGSTIVDLAFHIHEAIGFSIKSATINDESVSIFSKLRDYDKVVIHADTREENGILIKFIPHARISWLKHVKTPQARDRLIKYFERQYEGDDPQHENTVKDRVIETVLNNLFDEPCLANIEA